MITSEEEAVTAERATQAIKKSANAATDDHDTMHQQVGVIQTLMKQGEELLASNQNLENSIRNNVP